MMTLGPVAFSVATTAFQRLRRVTAFRWPALERVGRWPARQFTGPGQDQITLDGVIMPTYRGSAGSVEALRELALTGQPYQMSAGTGEVYGLWCLSQVEEDRSGLFANAAPRRVAWVLQLVRYGDDAPGGLQGALARDAGSFGDQRRVLDTMARAVDSGASPAAVVDAGREASGGPETAASREVLPAAEAVAEAGGSPEAVRGAAYEAAARTSRSGAPVSPMLQAAAGVAYRAAEGEVLDEVAHLRYGTPAVVEELLEANPRSAAVAPRLPGGTLVDLPPAAAAPATPAVSLWD